jgi:hypothetical protein
MVGCPVAFDTLSRCVNSAPDKWWLPYKISMMMLNESPVFVIVASYATPDEQDSTTSDRKSQVVDLAPRADVV